MRNFTYFLAGFLVIFLFGLTTACSMPLRKPEPYEQRDTVAKTEQSDDDKWRAEKEALHAQWWMCMYRNRADEC